MFLFPECVYRFTSTRGQIRSKNYPNNYDNNLDCRYLISVPSNYEILISFIEINLEEGPNCNYDFVRVYDGGDASQRTMGKFCGTSLPTPLRSTGNEMLIQFKTDDRQPRKGFVMNWRRVEKRVATTPSTTRSTTPATQSGNCIFIRTNHVRTQGFSRSMLRI